MFCVLLGCFCKKQWMFFYLSKLIEWEKPQMKKTHHKNGRRDTNRSVVEGEASKEGVRGAEPTWCPGRLL